MTAVVVLTCDRTRNRQPCRGSLPTRATSPGEARRIALRQGWSVALIGDPLLYVDTCPSAGHDEEPA